MTTYSGNSPVGHGGLGGMDTGGRAGARDPAKSELGGEGLVVRGGLFVAELFIVLFTRRAGVLACAAGVLPPIPPYMT